MRLPLFLTLSMLSGPVMAEVPAVVTDIPAVHALVAQVMEGVGKPVLLLDRGADAHDFQLRPSQAQALAGADLVVWIGPEMTPWLQRALDGTGTRAQVLGLLAAEGTYRRNYGDAPEAAHAEAHGHDHAHEHGDGHGEGHDHGHAEAHDHDHDHDHAEADDHNHGAGQGHDHGGSHGHDLAHGHDHAHSGTDPHAWLDPANAAHWLGLIAADLARIDAANAPQYASNAARAQEAVAALDARVAGILAPAQGRPFVVFHDAYGYFAAHYGLTVAGSIALGDAATPGAARLRATQDLLRTGAVACVFPEAQHDPRLVATVTEGTGVRIGGALDPSGTSHEPGADLYAGLMEQMATTLRACLAP